MGSGVIDPKEVLELIGLDLKEKNMRILRALLRARGVSEGYRDFEDIYRSFVETEETREIPRNTVYEALSALEKRHFIRIERKKRRHRYQADAETIGIAMGRIITDNIDRRLSQLSGLILPEEEELKDLMDDTSLGERAEAILQGRRFKSEPKVATRLGQIENLVKTEVLSKCRTGDTIRVFFEPLESHMLDDKSTIAIGKFLSSGCEVRAMVHSEAIPHAYLKAASEVAFKRRQRFIVKLRTSRTKIYEIVACGSRGIVLVISSEPLVATYVPRSANSTLVDHAIETFDKEFSKSELRLDTSEQESV